MKNTIKTVAALLFLTPAALSMAQDGSSTVPAPITVANPMLTQVIKPVLTQVVLVPVASNTLSKPTQVLPVGTKTPSAAPQKKKTVKKTKAVPTSTPTDTE